MKKLIAFLFVAMIATTSFASSHIKVKGIEINGTLNEMVQQLESTGLKFISRKDGQVTLKGSFAGYSNCVFHVNAAVKTNVVSSVVVMLPDEEIWSVLEEEYLELTKRYTEKYGEPYTEEYNQNASDGDFARMVALKDGNASFRSVYQLSDGIISVKIAYSNYPYSIKGHVEIIYNDNINETLRQKEFSDEI